jgi:hypothetical protein
MSVPKVRLCLKQDRVSKLEDLHQVDEDKTYHTLFVFGSVALFAASVIAMIMLVAGQ